MLLAALVKTTLNQQRHNQEEKHICKSSFYIDVICNDTHNIKL